MPSPSGPEWAAFFTPERFDVFLEKVRNALTRAGVDADLNVHEGSWQERGGTEGKVFGLVNLAQVCNQLPMDDWDSEIQTFLSRVRVEHHADEVPEDFETVCPMLRVRLFAAESVSTPMLVTKDLAPGFVTCLAVDLPDKIVTVTPDRAAGYGRPIDDLFYIALQNVVETATPEKKVFPVSDEAEISSLSGDDFFTASLALALGQITGFEPPYGRLVAVPGRHQVLYADLDSRASLGALGPLVFTARAMFRDGPGSISPYVYWVRDDRWQRLSVEVTDEGVGVESPEEFIDAVLRPLLG